MPAVLRVGAPTGNMGVSENMLDVQAPRPPALKTLGDSPPKPELLSPSSNFYR